MTVDYTRVAVPHARIEGCWLYMKAYIWAYLAQHPWHWHQCEAKLWTHRERDAVLRYPERRYVWEVPHGWRAGVGGDV